MLELQTKARDAQENLDTLRAGGDIPVVMYGGGVDNTLLSVNRSEFNKIFASAGEATMITLTGAAGGKQVVVQHVQRHPAALNALHVDFKAIEAGKATTFTVPLEFIGEAPAEKDGLGTVGKAIQEIEVECLPKDLPSHIDVDVSVLATADAQIKLADLVLPTDVTLEGDTEVIVASIVAIKEEAEEEGATEIDFDAIAVEKKGKSEEEAPAE